MSKKILLVISSIIITIFCILLILILQNQARDNYIDSDCIMYPNATMDMLIDDGQYIALVEVIDNKKEGENIDTTLKVLETYKGEFESNEIIYRNSNGKVLNSDSHPTFIKGDKMILFMWKEPKDNTYYLYYGIQGAFKFDDIQKKYINSNNIKFIDMKEEIEKFNNKPLEERELLPKGDFFDNI